jgi:hypothetical protein
VRLPLAGAPSERSARDAGAYCLVSGLPTRVGEPAPGGQSVHLLARRCTTPDDIAPGASCASHFRRDRKATSAAAGSTVVRARMGTGSRPGLNASCSRPIPKGYASCLAPVTQRIFTPAQKSCISSTVSCGLTHASSARVTTTTARPEGATNGSGARRAAPAFSSPAPRTFCDGEAFAFRALRLVP